MHQAKTYISQRIRAVWSFFTEDTLWVAVYPKRLQVDCEDYADWTFAGHTYNAVERRALALLWNHGGEN